MGAGEPVVGLSVRAMPIDLRGALERIYARHKHDVYRIALRYGGGRSDWAEDVTQDVFVSLARNIDSLDARDDLMGWLYCATTRRCLNRLETERSRARAPVRWLIALIGGEPSRPDAIVGARDAIVRALAHLDSLPPKERVAFAMFRIDQRPIEEIARTMGHTKGYVSKLISRADARLREVLT
jgi:RNA polymerase sigma-70 factor (ECF subfamily)